MLADIINNPRLILQLSANDFKSKFSGSYFGLLWALIQPIMTIFVFWFVFQVGFRTPIVEKVPFVLWFMTGLIPWFYFAESWSSGTNCFLEYSYLIKKVIFKVNLIPIIKIISALYLHIFFLFFMVVVFLLYGQPITIYIIQIFYYMFCLLVYLFSLVMLTSSIVVFFRDITQIVSILLQFGMWLTPIMWSYKMIPEKWRWFLNFNPMYYIVEGYRDSLFNQIWFWDKLEMSCIFWGITGVLFVSGIVIYNKLKIHFADVL
ncbi:MAG: ABC transporter permease [bacterium]